MMTFFKGFCVVIDLIGLLCMVTWAIEAIEAIIAFWQRHKR